MRTTEAEARFIRAQGVTTAAADRRQYSALMFQPRVVGTIVAIGTALQRPWVFLALSAVLWWSSLVPSRNPFDAIYNRVVLPRRGGPPLGPAARPRRFAAGMAGTLALATGLTLLAGAATAAHVIEALLLVAVAAVVFGRFCAGSFMYSVLVGRTRRPRLTPPGSSPDSRRPAPHGRPDRRSSIAPGGISRPGTHWRRPARQVARAARLPGPVRGVHRLASWHWPTRHGRSSRLTTPRVLGSGAGRCSWAVCCRPCCTWR
jgi:hypothetical protein